MKKLRLFALCVSLMFVAVGCSYDDGYILEQLDNLEQEIQDVKDQLDVTNAVLNAQANKLTITEVRETENGYVIVFSDGSQTQISNGKDGQNGQDGKDGQNGQDGKDGQNGQDGKDGQDGDEFFQNVIITETSVTFIFADGVQVVIPKEVDTDSYNEIIYSTTDSKAIDEEQLFDWEEYDFDFGGADLLINEYYPDYGFGVLMFSNHITKIGQYAFAGMNTITSITLPDSVTEISEGAFLKCAKLESIILPNNLRAIDSDAFCDCTSLENVTIPESVFYIGSYAFAFCESLKTINIPTALEIYGYGMFVGCKKLSKFDSPYASEDGRFLILNNTIYTFAPEGLSKITIPDGVTYIYPLAFAECDNIVSVSIPDSVKTIGEMAFAYCDNLISATIGKGIVSIGEQAFYKCNNLSAFYGDLASSDNRCLIVENVLKAFAPAYIYQYSIPSTVTSIDDNVFAYCKNLTSITIPDSVKSIGYSAFYECSYLSSITLGQGVVSIGEQAFAFTESLKNVTLSDSVQKIGEYAFYGSGLTSVTLGSGLTDVGAYAFGYCNDLSSVYCKATIPPAGHDNMFIGNASARKIYVPSNSVSTYKNADYWSSYSSSIYGYSF